MKKIVKGTKYSLFLFFVSAGKVYAKTKDVWCDPDNKTGIQTAIGCVPIGDTNTFIAFVLKWAIGLGGGLAFLLILLGGFQVMTSNGNPEKIQAGKELITSAIMGLVMLILSIFILKFVGVDILGLDALGL